MAYLFKVLSRGGLLERKRVGRGGGGGVIAVIEMCNVVLPGFILNIVCNFHIQLIPTVLQHTIK